MHLRGLYALTNVSIGLWTAGARVRKLLLCLPEKRRFVLIVVHGAKASKNGALGRALEQVNSLLDKRNPFSTHGSAGQRPSIVALELEWDSVVGTDFLFPLHQDARLVLESRVLTKRLFHTMTDLEHFYGWRSTAGRGTAVRAAWQGDARLSRLTSSLSRRVSMLQQAQAQSQAQGQGLAQGQAQGLAGAQQTPAIQQQGLLQTPGQTQWQPALHVASPALQVLRRQLSAPLHGLYSAQRRGRRQRSLKARPAQQQDQEQDQHQGQAVEDAGADAARSSTDVGTQDATAGPEPAGAHSTAGDCGPMPDQASPFSRPPPPSDGSCATPTLQGQKCMPGARQQAPSPGQDACEVQSIGGSPQPGPVDLVATPAADGLGEEHGKRIAPDSHVTPGGTSAAQGHLPLPPSPWLAQATPALPSRPPRASAPSWRNKQPSLQQQQQQQQQPQGRLVDVPTAARWTSVAAAYANRTVIINFRDAALTQELRVFVQSDMRLLKLYESGLPAWAVLLPSYGLPYHPWMRRATWLLFVVLSFVSMACGFYDLYKNVPYVKQFVTASLLRLHLPATALFEWLERHTQIRLSILLTWLFSRSPLFSAGLRALRAAAALGSQLLAPVSRALAPLVAAAGAALSSTLQPVAQPLVWACSSAAAALTAALGSAGGAVWRSAAAGWQAAGWACQPLLQLLHSFLQLVAAAWGTVCFALEALAAGPAMVLGSTISALTAAVQDLRQAALPLAGAAWQALQLVQAALAPLAAAAAALFAAVRSAVAAMAPAVRLARTSGAAAAAVAGASSAGSVGGIAAASSWLAAELSLAQDFMLSTGSRCLKGAQAVINFLVTWAMAISRHRVSLLLQAKQALPLPLVPPLAAGADGDAELDSSAAAGLSTLLDSAGGVRQPGASWTDSAGLPDIADHSSEAYTLHSGPSRTPGLLPGGHVPLVRPADRALPNCNAEHASTVSSNSVSDWLPSWDGASGLRTRQGASTAAGYESDEWWDTAPRHLHRVATREGAVGLRSSLDTSLLDRRSQDGELQSPSQGVSLGWQCSWPQQGRQPGGGRQWLQSQGPYLRPSVRGKAQAAAAGTAATDQGGHQQQSLQRSSWGAVSAWLGVEGSQRSNSVVAGGSAQTQISSPGSSQIQGGEGRWGTDAATSRLRWLGSLVRMPRAASTSQLSALVRGAASERQVALSTQAAPRSPASGRPAGSAVATTSGRGASLSSGTAVVQGQAGNRLLCEPALKGSDVAVTAPPLKQHEKKVGNKPRKEPPKGPRNNGS